jgi:hypothetical protein
MKKIPTLEDLYECHLKGTELKMGDQKVFIYSNEQITHETCESVTHWFRLNNGIRIMYEVPNDKLTDID